MNVSDNLKEQIKRLQNQGAFSLNTPLKKELKEKLNEAGLEPLNNLECGTCIRDGLYRLGSHLEQVGEKPVLQMQMVKPKQTRKRRPRTKK